VPLKNWVIKLKHVNCCFSGCTFGSRYTRPLNNADEALEFAKQFGLPIAIKAAFGGGGRGLKVVWKLEEVKELYESAVREAKAAFGRGECFVEQYLDQPAMSKRK
jgi:acetyl/propionyl-CoA carboxylase alpha subunit